MNVIYKQYPWKPAVTVPVSDYVYDALTQCRYMTGPDKAIVSANNSADAIARLCNLLAKRGILDMVDLAEIAGVNHTMDDRPPVLHS